MLLNELTEYRESSKVFADDGDLMVTDLFNGYLIDRRTEHNDMDIPDVWSILKNSMNYDYYVCPYCSEIHTSKRAKGELIVPDCMQNEFPTKGRFYFLNVHTGKKDSVPQMKLRLHRCAKEKD